MKKKKQDLGVKLILKNFDTGEVLDKVNYRFKKDDGCPKEFFENAIWRIDNLT